MIEIGKVIEIKPDGRAVVRFDRKASCDKCSMCMMSKKDMHIDYAMDNAGAKEGDAVSVDLSAAALSVATLIVYVLPLLFALAAFLLTRGVDERIQLGAVLGAVAVSFGIAAFADAKYFKRKRLRPRMVKIMRNEGQESDKELEVR
ncbi:MAG: SoxR reducing system RseC family protein [Clostridiales bacterium]|jgi:positive regulator of sigma E activity|nr:SoxR reducing system RseC family protein [Clostridiales bacterium]